MAAIRDDVRDAVDLITQPWVLEVLVGTESGHGPRSAVAADADPEELRAAVDRLTAIGAVNAQTNEATQDEPLTLTSRGAELLRLLRELEEETSA